MTYEEQREQMKEDERTAAYREWYFEKLWCERESDAEAGLTPDTRSPLIPLSRDNEWARALDALASLGIKS